MARTRNNPMGDEATASKAIIAEQQTRLQARDAEVKRLHESELEKQRELEVLRTGA